jgi:hypothetical protein
MAVNLDDGGVDHRVFHVRIVRHGVEHPLEHIGLHPVAKAFEHGVPLAEGGRQIAPGATRARNPQDRLQKQSPIAPGAAGIGGLAKTKGLHLRPLGVRQTESGHRKLLSELESSFRQNGNPDSQQALDQNLFNRRGHRIRFAI